MRWTRSAAIPVAVCLAAACSDAGVVEADLVGTWAATQFEFRATSGDPVVTFDFIQNGAAVTIVINATGTYQVTVTPAGGGAPDVESGTWTLDGGDLLILTATGDISGTELDVSLSGATLTVHSTDVEFDLNEDGTDEPAILNAIFVKQ